MAAAGSAAGLLRAGEGRKKNDPVLLLQTASRKQPAARNAAGCNPLEEEKVQATMMLGSAPHHPVPKNSLLQPKSGWRRWALTVASCPLSPVPQVWQLGVIPAGDAISDKFGVTVSPLA